MSVLCRGVMVWWKRCVVKRLFFVFVFLVEPLSAKVIQDTKQSILFQTVSTQQVLFLQDAEQSLVPASLSKLITSAAALYYLGPHVQFKTGLYHTGQNKNGVVFGDVILKGGGDPVFVAEDLWKMVVSLKNSGYKTFKGQIVLDDSCFVGNLRDLDNQTTRPLSSKAYDALVSGLGMNFNTHVITVAPAFLPGVKAFVKLFPYALEGVTIDNQVFTTPTKGKEKIEITRTVLKDGRETFVVKGFIYQKSLMKTYYRSVLDPLKTMGDQLRAYLKAQGIVVQGSVVRRSMETKSTLIVEHQSKSLGNIVQDLNFFSNNYLADVLVNQIGLQTKRLKSKTPLPFFGTYERGIEVIKRFMTDVVRIKSRFVFKSGSGLNSKNLLSARQVVAVLSYMARRVDLFPDYLVSLPSAGHDGTLKDRFQSTVFFPLKGKIRAKTGTLLNPNVSSSLAGYMQHPKHGLVAFAVIQSVKRKEKFTYLKQLQESQEAYVLKVINS